MIAGSRVAGSSGKPALLFVHGVGSTAAIWDRQLAAFGSDYLCAAIELRGNGAQPDPDPSLITRAGFAEDVLTVADAIGVERFTVVGCSLGGVVAFELWRRNSARIRAMLILGSFARYPDGERYASDIRATVAAAGVIASAPDREAPIGLERRLTRTR